jgi:large subunit ribosomal protein L23
VDLKANKIQIKEAIEKFFNVKVNDVRTLIRKGKSRRVRFKLGRTKDWKKAIVTLEEGNVIDLGY